MAKQAHYGAWASPIEAAALARAGKRLGQVFLADGAVHWVEGRPDEGGRSVLMRKSVSGGATEVTPAPFDVRTRVHEYGGGAYTAGESAAYFCHDADGRVYVAREGEEALRALTPEGPWRFADLHIDAPRSRLYAVCERALEGAEPANDLVTMDVRTGAMELIAAGHDFYASPRLSPDGAALVWLTWDHPRMPWDGTELWCANVDEAGRLSEPQRIAGGASESVFQPEWSPNGTLYFVSDRGGWWNLHRYIDGNVECVLEDEAEYGLPQWVFGQSTYAFVSNDEIVAARRGRTGWQLNRVFAATGEREAIELGFSEISSVCANDEAVAFIAGSAQAASAVVAMARAPDGTFGEARVLAHSSDYKVESAFISAPEPFEYESAGGEISRGFFYAPANADFEAPSGERPPLIVMAHGGPTGSTSASLNVALQFWTSRGFAVLDVNYRGSTGYGRPYREKLKGQWGIADVEDCVHGAQALAREGRVDGERLAIRGGSAGGYTVLAALTFHDVFKAGASYYGIGDLEALARDTHKFESRYLDSLIGPYPEDRELYRERSPINHVDRLSCPAIFFQGLEDKVVPPNQAEMMVAALDAKGLPVAYLAFEGEQHGFRKAETVTRTLEAELYFYGRIFGFEPAGDLTPVPIKNL